MTIALSIFFIELKRLSPNANWLTKTLVLYEADIDIVVSETSMFLKIIH